MNFFQFHIGDYAAHTRNLSLIEDLAYRRLLDAYYLNERPFNGSSTDVAREIGMRDQQADVEYILGKFFERDGECWRNKRADLEIEKYQGKLQQASMAGKASAERRFNAGSTDVEKKPTPVDVLSNGRVTNQEPRTKNQEPLKPMGGKPPKPEAPEKFELAWGKYPKRDGNNPRADALKSWLARVRDGVSEDAMLAGTDRYRRWCEHTGKIGTETVMQAVRFFGASKIFEQDFSIQAGVKNAGSRANAAATIASLTGTDRSAFRGADRELGGENCRPVGGHEP